MPTSSAFTASACALAAASLALPLNAAAHPGDGIGADSRGNIFFTDVASRTLWKLEPGGGLSAAATGCWAHGLCVDARDRVWIEVEEDNERYSIRRIETDGTVTRVLGPVRRGPELYGVNLAADSDGNLYFPHSDPPAFFAAGIRVRRPGGQVELLAGGDEFAHRDGVGAGARFTGVNALRLGPDRNLYVVDGDAVRRVTPAGVVTTVATGIKLPAPPNQPFDNGNPAVSNRLYGLDISPDGTVYVAYHGDRCVLALSDGRREVVYRSWKPWSPVGVAIHGDDLVIKESGLEPGSPSPGPRVRLLRTDGTVQTLVEVGKH